jgi:putative SOS response-associated peptidase YedK
MCYSAMVNQKVKSLGITYKARVQIDMFEDLFKLRAAGSKAKIPKAMEAEFMGKAKTPIEMRIQKYIREFRSDEIKRSKDEIKKQTERLIDAEKTLLTKVTKKAQSDQRIATDKIESLTYRITNLESEKLSEMDSRIYPGMYAPLITMIDGERIVAPFRYLLRPSGQPETFDRKYNGAYNMRRDSLDKVFWWKNLYGRSHGFMEIQSFWENVTQNAFEGRKLKPAEDEKKIVLRFDPEGLDHMIVPCIYDFNTEAEFPLQSFALITDDPNPEVAAVGHDRTPVIMREKYIDTWLNTSGKDLKRFDVIFEDKQPTFFDHVLSA